MKSPEDVLRAQLFERRIVFLRGPLDDAVAGDIAAQLMTLDASGDEPVQLHVDSPGGPLEQLRPQHVLGRPHDRGPSRRTSRTWPRAAA